jgi:hypothetical protein
MATIPRVVYFAQTGVLTTPYHTYILPVMSANIDVSRPIESMSTFSKFSSLNTAQTNLTSCKATLKCHLGGGSGINGIDTYFLNDLISNTQSSSGFSLQVSPNGFSMTGILTNIGLDISVGGLGMCDLSFAGIGNPNISTPISTATDSNTLMNITPVTMNSVVLTGSLSGVYATSLKLSYDLPTDTLSRLGDNPNATQGNLVSTIATKPPYKATINTEGYGVDPTRADSFYKSQFNIGDLKFYLPNAKVNSRSFNNAAGQVSAKFNYAIEDSTCTFVDPYNYVGVRAFDMIANPFNGNWAATATNNIATFSSWFCLDSQFLSINPINLFSVDSLSHNVLYIYKDYDNSIKIIAFDSSNNIIFTWNSSANLIQFLKWFHLMVSINTSTQTVNVYFNGNLLTPTSFIKNNTNPINFNISADVSPIFEIGNNTNNGYLGQTTAINYIDFSELYFNVGYFATDTTPFISVYNRPVSPVPAGYEVYMAPYGANIANNNPTYFSIKIITPPFNSPYGKP